MQSLKFLEIVKRLKEKEEKIQLKINEIEFSNNVIFSSFVVDDLIDHFSMFNATISISKHAWLDLEQAKLKSKSIKWLLENNVIRVDHVLLLSGKPVIYKINNMVNWKSYEEYKKECALTFIEIIKKTNEKLKLIDSYL